jgi:glutamyl-tRNA reductase
MAIVTAGINHRTAPIEVRERCVYGAGDVLPALAGLRAMTGARECGLLSTCNRTEFYVVESEGDSTSAIWAALSARVGAEAAPLGYVRRDRDAVRHLMRVASGLDSMVLGEAQITGQVREAWELGRIQSGPVLNRLFQSALSVAGRVRAETAIGRGAASVSSAAVLLAKKIFGSLQGRCAMVLGAGDMAELALQCLHSEGVRAALVTNRTFEHAEEMARRHGATALRYEDCWDQIRTVDLLICSTAAPHHVVSRQQLAGALARRGDRPLCILDIALPRDVEPTAGELENVFLYDLDDLRAVAAANVELRRAELPSAEQLIDAEIDRYWTWLAGLAAVPVVAGVRTAMDRVRADELAQLVRRMGADLTPRQREAIEHFSRALMNKFLHEPSVRLRAAAASTDGLGIVEAARYLFALDPPGAVESIPAEFGERSSAADAAVRTMDAHGATGRDPAGAHSSAVDDIDGEAAGPASGATQNEDVSHPIGARP